MFSLGFEVQWNVKPGEEVKSKIASKQHTQQGL